MKDTVQSHLLFTYGTMMTECYNNGRIAGSTFLGKAQTCEPFIMVGKTEPRQIPYVGRVEKETSPELVGFETAIRGEVYEIDNLDTWRTIDRAEGHPHFYERELISVRTDAGLVLKCWCYLMDNDFFANGATEYGDWIASGDFLKFYSSKLHQEQGHKPSDFWGKRNGRKLRQTNLIDEIQRFTRN